LIFQSRDVKGPVSTLTSRSICYRADVQRINLASGYSEVRQSGERVVPLRSLNHLIRALQQRRWDREPQRLRGLRVEDQFEFGRLLDREFPWLSSLEDLVHIRRGAPPPIGKARPVSDEAASFRVLSLCAHGWQPMLQCQARKLVPIRECKGGS